MRRFHVLGFLSTPFTLALLINPAVTVTSRAFSNLPGRSTLIRCECDGRHSPPPKGMYCGCYKWSDTHNYVVTSGRNDTHLYFCDPHSCQDYGYNEDCDLANNTKSSVRCAGPF